MALRELLLPWDAQPQEAVEPDRAALARFGIVGGILVRGDWQQNPPDLVSGAGLTYSVGSGNIVGFRPVVRAPGVVVEYFDDGSGRTVAHSTGSPSIRSMTYLARVRVNVAPTSPGVVCRGGATGSTGNILLWRNGTNFDMRVNSTDYTGAGTWNLGQWYDVEIVSDTSACVMYVDGQAVISGSAAATGTMDSLLAWGDVAGGGISSGDVEIQYSLFSNRPLTISELAEFRANPWQLFEPRRIPVPVAVGGGATSDLAATGDSGTFSGTANSPPTATLAQTGASGALSASAYPLVTAALSQTGASGIFVGSAFSPATAALAATGQSGAFSGAANSPATATLEATGNSGALSASASASTTVDLAITGGSGALSAVASAPASASAALLGASGALLASAATEALAVLAAQGGEGAFAGSAYPLTQADLAALGASGAFSGSAPTAATAQAAITGASGDLSATAWTPATATAALIADSGTLLAAVTGASGTAAAADVWNYVLSNGKTAEQTAVETHAMLTALLGGTFVFPANVKQVNDIAIVGAGVTGDSFRPAA